jgi:hypothetical protein
VGEEGGVISPGDGISFPRMEEAGVGE